MRLSLMVNCKIQMTDNYIINYFSGDTFRLKATFTPVENLITCAENAENNICGSIGNLYFDSDFDLLLWWLLRGGSKFQADQSALSCIIRQPVGLTCATGCIIKIKVFGGINWYNMATGRKFSYPENANSQVHAYISRVCCAILEII